MRVLGPVREASIALDAVDGVLASSKKPLDNAGCLRSSPGTRILETRNTSTRHFADCGRVAQNLNSVVQLVRYAPTFARSLAN
jgi:hypothetical protein